MLFGPWEAVMECTACGERWLETEPPEGFLELPERERRKVVDEFIAADHWHACGIFQKGLTRCVEMMRCIPPEEALAEAMDRARKGR